MYKQFLTIMTALTLFGFAAGTASAANIVSISEGTTINTTPGATLDLTIVGNFTDVADAAGFALSFDAGVLSYTGGAILPPLNDPFFSSIDASNAGTGSIQIGVGSFLASATGPFDIATISFNVVGGNGDSSLVNFTDSCLGCGWFGGGNALTVDYTNSQVQVGAVPVPPAVWLMFSGLLGLVGIGRRSRRV
jgi:hypothetical protein